MGVRSSYGAWQPLGAFILLALLGLGLAWLTRPIPQSQAVLRLEPIGFDHLPGWGQDDPVAALAAFQRACAPILKRTGDSPIGPNSAYGRTLAWQEVCRHANNLPVQMRSEDDRHFFARHFFESEFTPYRVFAGANDLGLFTGYYELEAKGSLTRLRADQAPIFVRPDDLIDVDLGAFAPDLKGRRTAGKIRGNRLEPYPDRGQIMEGALGASAKPLAFLDDPVDAFFMEIQGSGRIRLADNSILRVGFSGQNGHAYTALGREMIRRGLMRRKDVSMQSLRRYLTDHPDQRDDLLRSNRSYVFFKPLTGLQDDLGPLGADGTQLTPGRSLAVDRSFHGLGAPVYVDATDADGRTQPVRRLLIAQDTGGAIRGPVRGDIFWGAGEDAANRAGLMRAEGRMYVFLPKSLSPVSLP
jgi:membrane-bound lytic murein transglycosylase A